MDAKHIKWLTGKRQPNRERFKTTFNLPSVMDLHFKKRLAKYSMKTMAADKGMIKV
jgi:hypothetical protein